LKYDRFGNLLASLDKADDATATDDIYAFVTYKLTNDAVSKWLVSLPEEIKVCTSSTSVGNNILSFS
jgi:hypothetical protein